MDSRISFRPRRYRVRDCPSLDNARVEVDGHPGEILDLSMSGLAYWASPQCPPWEVGSEHYVKVRVDGDLVHKGRARVVRIENSGGEIGVGVELLEGFLDLPGILRRQEERELKAALSEGPEPCWKLVPVGYREVLTYAAYCLQYWRDLLDHHEQRYMEEGQDRNALEALTDRALHRIRPSWSAICEELSSEALPFMEDEEQLRAARRLTSLVLTPLLMDCDVVACANMRQGLGPDLFRTALKLRNSPVRGSAFARLVHRLAAEDPLVRALDAREDFIKSFHMEECAAAHERLGRDQVFRATSLGCGSAQELVALAHSQSTWGRKVCWTLADYEEAALSHAHTQVFPIASCVEPPIELRCVRISFDQLLNAPLRVVPSEAQQFIYSAGLLDGMGTVHARALVRALYARLAPGGLLAMGNALYPCDRFWFREFVLRWPMHYRVASELRGFAEGLPMADCQVEQEPSGTYQFLLLRKRLPS